MSFVCHTDSRNTLLILDLRNPLRAMFHVFSALTHLQKYSSIFLLISVYWKYFTVLGKKRNLFTQFSGGNPPTVMSHIGTRFTLLHCASVKLCTAPCSWKFHWTRRFNGPDVSWYNIRGNIFYENHIYNKLWTHSYDVKCIYETLYALYSYLYYALWIINTIHYK